MAKKKSNQSNEAKKDQQSRTLTPTASKNPAVESGQPGGGQGREDVTGVIRDKIRVDPYITEGHPGYDETGPSEITHRQE
jgi:hypothetical protein